MMVCCIAVYCIVSHFVVCYTMLNYCVLMLHNLDRSMYAADVSVQSQSY